MAGKTLASTDLGSQRAGAVSTVAADSRNDIRPSTVQSKMFEEVAKTLFDCCKRLTGATSGYVALLSADGVENEVVLLDAGGRPCSADLDLPMPVRGLRAVACQTGQVAYDNDFAASRWMQFIPDGHTSIDNVLFAPLILADRVVGLIGLANKPGGFTEEDCHTAAAIGDTAAIALLNSRTLEDLEELTNQRTAELAKANEQLQGKIVERKRAQEALVESLGELQAIYDGVFDGLLIADRQTKQFLRVNRAMCRLLGYSEDELLEMSVTDIHPQEVLAHVLEQFDAQANGELSVAESLPFQRKDGSVFYADVAVGANQAEYRDRPCAIGFVRDVTQRKQAEEALRDSEERYRAIFDQAADSIVVIDRETGGLVEFNTKAHENLGYTREEFQKLKIADFDINESAEEVADHTRKIARDGSDTFEAQHRTKTGDIKDVLVKSSVISIGGRRFLLALWRDVTDVKRAEEALQQSERRRQEAEKLAATGRMAARIAHEINNPLAGIKNICRLVEETVPQQLGCHKWVRQLDKEIGRVAEIIQQMLDLHRPSRRSESEVAIAQLVDEVVELARPSADRRGISLETAMEDVGLVARLAEASLRQILANLLANAIDASPEGGEVKLSAATTEDRLRIAVSDRGPGIPEEMWPLVFEPFFTTKKDETTGGLGLGLSISKALAATMEGSLSFSSQADRGCVFLLEVPFSSTEKEKG